MELPASEVTMYEGTENNLETPPYIYYFRYVPYLFLAVLSYSMGYVLLAFQKEDILKRMRASAVSLRRQNMEASSFSRRNCCGENFPRDKERSFS